MLWKYVLSETNPYQLSALVTQNATPYPHDVDTPFVAFIFAVVLPVFIVATGYELADVEVLALLEEIPHTPRRDTHLLVGLVVPAKTDALSDLVKLSTNAFSFVNTETMPTIML